MKNTQFLLSLVHVHETLNPTVTHFFNTNSQILTEFQYGYPKIFDFFLLFTDAKPLIMSFHQSKSNLERVPIERITRFPISLFEVHKTLNPTII